MAERVTDTTDKFIKYEEIQNEQYYKYITITSLSTCWERNRHGYGYLGLELVLGLGLEASLLHFFLLTINCSIIHSTIGSVTNRITKSKHDVLNTNNSTGDSNYVGHDVVAVIQRKSLCRWCRNSTANNVQNTLWCCQHNTYT